MVAPKLKMWVSDFVMLRQADYTNSELSKSVMLLTYSCMQELGE